MHKIAANIAYAVGNAAKIAGYIHDVGNLRTGLGLPIKPALLDIDALCKGVVEKIMLRFPDHALHFEGSTFLEGCFDEARITQAFAGVIAYALDQCAANDPVSVKLHADGDTLVFSVRYVAAEMEEAQTMFDPMRRYALHVLSTKEPLSTLGIDLYIAREIVTAHDGEIRAYANEEGMHIEARLPLRAA
jgi:signal transduction histidine kinase